MTDPALPGVPPGVPPLGATDRYIIEELDSGPGFRRLMAVPKGAERGRPIHLEMDYREGVTRVLRSKYGLTCVPFEVLRFALTLDPPSVAPEPEATSKLGIAALEAARGLLS